jgi:hypothetical protein
MSRKNWDKVAFREFDSMDKDWQKDWADLRARVSRRRSRTS